MKFITHFQDLNARAQTRGVFLDKKVESGGEQKEGIDKILSSPLTFSLSQVTQLETAVSESQKPLTGAQQKAFATLINFHLARVQNEGDKSLRSRTLMAIFRAPSLNSFLTAPQRSGVEMVFSREQKELEKLGTKAVEKWKANDAVRVARSYRFIRNRLNTSNLRINPEFKNTGDNLKLYASRLVDKNPDDLTALDKLFLIELKRVFPRTELWNDDVVFNKVDAAATQVENDLKTIITNDGEISVEAREYWDTLTPDTKNIEPKLRDWLQQSAAIESLQSILEKDKSGDDIDDNRVPLLLSFEEYEFLADLSQKPVTSNVNASGESAKALDKAKESLAKAQKAVTDLNADRESSENTLKAKSLKELKNNEALDDKVKATFDETWTEESEAATKWKEQAAKSIVLADENLNEEKLKKLQEAEEGEKKIVSDASKVVKELEKKTLIYTNPAEKAKEAIENHKKYFNARLVSGRLLATDLDLLAQIEASNNDYELKDLVEEKSLGRARVVTDLMSQTRDLVTKTLGEELGVNSFDQISEANLNSVDKFLSYEGVMKLISAQKVSKKGSELLDKFETLDRESLIDARQLITAVTQQVRREVIETLEKPAPQQAAAYNQFIEHYARQHHSLQQTDRVEKLLSFTADIEKQKRQKVDDVYEHAYEKVSSLFAKAEEGAITQGLQKILLPSISATTVLTHIQQKLPDTEFIHSLGATSIASLESMIVSELKNKVTPENNDTAHLKLIAKDLLAKLDEMKSGEVAKEGLKAGAKQIEITDKNNLSVSDRLELTRRTQLIYLESVEVSEAFQSELDGIKVALEKGESTDRLVNDFLRNYSNHYFPRFDTLKEALVAECDLLFGKKTDLANKLESEIKQTLTNLSTGVEQMKRTHNDPNQKLTANDEGFKMLNTYINSDLLPLFNIDSGALAGEEKTKLDSTLHNAAHTHKFVRDDLGVMQPKGAETAEKNFDNKLKDYESIVDGFRDAWSEAKKRLAKDLKKYNEEEFAHKHQMPKKVAHQILKANDQRLEDADWMLDFFKGGKESPFKGIGGSVFDRWLKAYEQPNTQPAALKFMDYFRNFDEILKEEDFAKEATEMLQFVRDYDDNKPTLWFKKKYKIRVEWYSLRSIYMMGKQAYEFWSKRTERRNDRKAAELGDKLFGDSWLGREFARDSNEKQDQRVNDFKGVHKSSNYQELFKIIESAKHAENDKDEVQAAVELIMEKGELRWDSPEFLGMLDRLQDTVSFNPEQDIKDYIENPAKLKQKIGMAVTVIWDRPTWLQWKEDLPSKYKSRVDTHNNDYREEVQKGSVDTYLGGVLEQWGRGEMDTNFERSKFESYLKNAFDNGEMNGYPNGDRRWYYLIMGLTLKNPQGDTILSPDTLSRFGELQNKMPFMDAFDDGNSSKLDGRVVPHGTPGSHKDWTYEDFQHWAKYFDGVDPRDANKPATIKKVRTWLNETLLTTNDAQDRMAKAQLTGIDRDDAGMLPLLVSAERLRDGILRYSSGDKRPADDKYYVNLLGSFNNNFEDSVEYMNRILNEEDKEAAGYEDRKNTQLRRFGGMMRSYFMISQALAGNWDTEGTVGAVSLSDAEWQNNDGADHYKKISKAVQVFTGDEGLKIIDDKRYGEQKSTNQGKYDTKNIEHKNLMYKVRDVFKDEDNAYWGNTDKIEAFLRSTAINDLKK